MLLYLTEIVIGSGGALKKNDTIELEKDGFKTGVMYVNIIRIYNGRCILKASSLKREHRILNTYTLEKAIQLLAK